MVAAVVLATAGLAIYIVVPSGDGPAKLGYLGGVSCVSAVPSDGPMLYTSILSNTSSSRIIVEEAHLLEPANIDVLDSDVARIENTTSMGFSRLPVDPEFMEVWESRKPLVGYSLEPGQSVDVVQTIDMSAGANDASSAGMRITYRVDGSPRTFIADDTGRLLLKARCF